MASSRARSGRAGAMLIASAAPRAVGPSSRDGGAADGRRELLGGGLLAIDAPQSPQNFCAIGQGAPHVLQRIDVEGGASNVKRPSLSTSALSSASANSRAVWNRSSLAFASARAETSAKGAGMARSGATSRGSGAGSVRCRISVLVAVSATKGTRPASSSKSTTPTE